jgi:type II secretory ATPase GspE/PulE/Tfp pilus assembly ATPase PilB-like protein/FixJ family two-component response regulator
MSKLASLFLGKEEDRESIGPRPPETAERPSYRILFVDDEENVLSAMRRIFRQENYAIFTAGSAAEALEILEKESVHVVISDHRMPGMTGADLLRKIKSLYPRTIRIMLTGYADVDAIMGAINEGAVYKFITKPWNDEDLRLTVSLALEQFDLIRENESLKKQREAQDKKIKQLSRITAVNRSQLGNMLLRRKLISRENLDRALVIQARNKKLLPTVLMEMHLIDEAAIMKTIQAELGIDRVSPNEFSVPSALATLIPREVCEKSLLVPLRRTEGRLMVCMADPTDFMKADDLRFLTGMPIQPVLSTQKEIIDKLQDVFGEQGVGEPVISELDLMDPTESIEIILDEEDEETDVQELLREKDLPPAIRIVNAIISDALRHGASDVHIEPKTKYLMVRYRIDGLLQDKLHIPQTMHSSIVSRIKIMSELDISERRKPQDGRVTVKTSTRMVDMRISTLPTINGEKVVLRVLDKNASIKDLDELGFSEKDLQRITRFMSFPQGLILTTGPTGSGKTSTLYSLLQRGATVTKNFTTIEDPIEYYMGMAEQVSVREKIGLRFPKLLRAILRQDPNVIMLGEIRDFETAEVAFHGALTGHLVLSTLHTNGSIASITRLRDMGLKPYVISEALIGIVAQRLVRRICPSCKEEDSLSKEVLETLQISGQEFDFVPQKGKGCEHCNHTGYKGRIGIFEVLLIDGELKRMIHGAATENEIIRAARHAGMSTLLEDAVRKLREGVTSCEEVLRVLGPQNMSEVQCPHCFTPLAERFPFCPFCGTMLLPRCLRCQKSLEPHWKVCPYCGEKRVHQADFEKNEDLTILRAARETLPGQ